METEIEPLWNAEDVAKYMNLAKKTVQNNIICQPDFPKPLKPIPNSRTRRWIPSEVMDWVLNTRT